jgi:uridine phosphorylase
MAQFSDVNLMLSEQKIYHLDIEAENLSNTILTVGDPNRVNLITRHFDSIEFKHQHRGFVVQTGYFKNKHLTVISTGIGTQNVDIVINELDALVNIDFKTREIKSHLRSLRIIRLGTTGALQESIPVESFIINTHAIDLTGLMLYYNYPMNREENALVKAFMNHMNGRIPKIPVTVHASDAALAEQLTQIPESIKGICVTCNGFYAPQGRRLRLDTLYHHLVDEIGSFKYKDILLTNMEMETAALYGLSEALGHQCCSVNIVVNNRLRHEFIKSIPKAEEKLVEYSLEAIANIE